MVQKGCMHVCWDGTCESVFSVVFFLFCLNSYVSKHGETDGRISPCCFQFVTCSFFAINNNNNNNSKQR